MYDIDKIPGLGDTIAVQQTPRTDNWREVVIDDIKKAVHAAASSNQKIAMFHFQVLKNAKKRFHNPVFAPFPGRFLGL